MPAFADRLGNGVPMLAAWCGLPSPEVAGLLAREPVDAVVIDMQHGAMDLPDVIRAIALIRAAGRPSIVRIPVGAFATASRLLDAGADGIIAPMINSVDDARALAAFTRYPPVGERSWGPAGALALTGLDAPSYFAGANGTTKVFAMVETRAALAVVDDILAVPGVDGVFVGPADLSIALSDGAALDPAAPAVDEALAHVLARARAAGRLAAVYAHIPERGRRFAELGFDLVATSSDAGMLRAGAAAMLAILRG